MKKIAIVYINEQHTMMDEQKSILDQKYKKSWSVILVPAKGWTLEQQKEIISEHDMNIFNNRIENIDFVFASPIPYMVKEFGAMAQLYCEQNIDTLVFHNDNRDKKEIPGGKVIMVVSKTGWELV